MEFKCGRDALDVCVCFYSSEHVDLHNVFQNILLERNLIPICEEMCDVDVWSSDGLMLGQHCLMETLRELQSVENLNFNHLIDDMT